MSLRVIEVLSGSPASKAGIRPGDIIESLNGNTHSGACGFVYELGEQGQRGNHVHITPDMRVIRSPEYVFFFWIRLGFCQTTVTRAPRGGFALEIGPDVLERCWTPEDVLRYFETWIGSAEERAGKLRAWEGRIANRGANRDPRVGTAVLMVRTVQEQQIEDLQMEEVLAWTGR